MMTKVLLYTLCLFNVTISIAQFASESNPITTTSNGVRWIAAADIDGDGYQDIIAANRFGSNITWFKNTNSDAPFIANELPFLDQTSMVTTGDLDMDGDIDLIASTTPGQLIVWYENLDGLGSFSAQKIITNSALSPFFLLVEDIDVDGDLDVMSGGSAGRIEWYENVDGLGNFSAPILIDNTIGSSRSLAMADIDGDGDLDLSSVSAGNINLYWFENVDGFGDFGPKQAIGGNGQFATFTKTADFDGDNDIDILGVYLSLDKVVWHENLDGLGTFSAEKIINANDEPIGIVVGDFDNDNDMDILSCSGSSPTLKWYENIDGQGNFSEKRVIEEVFVGTKCLAVDMDNDGDIDAVRSSQNDDTIVWYENLLVLSTPESQLNSISIFPNPADTALFIESGDNNSLTQMRATNILGKNVWSSPTFKSEIDIKNWSTGIYFLEIENNAGQKKVFKIIKK